MPFWSILAALRSVPTFPRVRASGRRAGVRPQRASLAVETLEDRAVPSTFTVLNLADGGEGSLRQAILDANSPPSRGLMLSSSPMGYPAPSHLPPAS